MILAVVFAGTGVSADVTNDNLADATVIDLSPLQGSIDGNNTGSTREVDEPAPPDYSTSVWFAFTAVANERVVLETPETSFDTLLAVYTDSTPLTPPTFADLTLVGRNDNTWNTGLATSRIAVDTLAGTTYYVMFGGVAPEDVGAFKLSWRRPELARVLWQHTNGAATVWAVDSRGTAAPGPVYGPFSGWQPAKIAVRPDRGTRILWRHTNGAISIWTVDTRGALLTSSMYGPYPDWTVSDIFSQGFQVLLTWRHASGALGIWRLSYDADTVEDVKSFGPYPNWQPVTSSGLPFFATSPGDVMFSGNVRTLWLGNNGAIALWASNFGTLVHTSLAGSSPGWAPVNVAAGSLDGNTRILWRRSDGAVGMWRQRPNGSISSIAYGLVPGWEALQVEVGNGLTIASPHDVQLPAPGADSDPRILWRGVTGRMALWRTDTAGSLTATFAYGPFAGWSPAHLAVGPE